MADSRCGPGEFIRWHLDGTKARWGHVDVASPAFRGDRATGFGVALPVEAVRRLDLWSQDGVGAPDTPNASATATNSASAASAAHARERRIETSPLACVRDMVRAALSRPEYCQIVPSPPPGGTHRAECGPGKPGVMACWREVRQGR